MHFLCVAYEMSSLTLVQTTFSNDTYHSVYENTEYFCMSDKRDLKFCSLRTSIAYQLLKVTKRSNFAISMWHLRRYAIEYFNALVYVSIEPLLISAHFMACAPIGITIPIWWLRFHKLLLAAAEWGILLAYNVITYKSSMCNVAF